MESLSQEQYQVIRGIQSWLNAPDAPPIFIVTGSAGTGKTTLIRHLVNWLTKESIRFQLAAPTGRAARILASRIGQEARTLHSLLYVLGQVHILKAVEASDDFSELIGIRLHFQLRSADPDTKLMLIDEASMIGDVEGETELYRFGSGRLLTDLLRYTRLLPRRNAPPSTRILFIGDPAQLPPVGQSLSPALSPRYLRRHFGLEVWKAHLHTVYRQRADHPILEVATRLRKALAARRFNTFQLTPHPPGIRAASITEALDFVVRSYRQKESVVMLCRTNALARNLNRAIRERLWGRSDLPLQPGDLLLINRNAPRYNLFNGDLMRVEEVASQREHRRIGRRGRPPVDLYFRDVVLTHLHSNARLRIPCKILENLLESPDGQPSPDLFQALLIDFKQRHPELKPEQTEYKLALLQDPYFNALHVRYGYVLTVHKAQGGEWQQAVVVFDDWRHHRNAEFFRWVYTAITRAQEALWIVGAPQFDAYSRLRWQPTMVNTKPDPPAPSTESTGPIFSTAFLQEYHHRLQQALTRQGIQVRQVEQLPYSVRYYLYQDDRTARIQYYYRASGKVSQVIGLGGADDPALTRKALALFHQVLLDPPAASAKLPSDPFLQAFIERVQQCLKDTDVQVVHWETLPYALRVHFRQGTENLTVDFYYNRRQEWTTARPVGRAFSGALFERIQTLLQSEG
ncbi:MAG: AAA family ATPase [Rhodothermus sp.]|nr:AAA family ATPase [Rhodothermus sp.]